MFFFVWTKNLNWEILTKNLLTFKRWDGVKDWKFWYYDGSLKNPIFKGEKPGFVKNQYNGGNYLKRGAWRVCRFKGGLAKKGGLIPQCTLWLDSECIQVTYYTNTSTVINNNDTDSNFILVYHIIDLIFKSFGIRHVRIGCCHVWAGIPKCYLELLDKLLKWIHRTVCSSIAASLEPLAHHWNVASLHLFYRYNLVLLY